MRGYSKRIYLSASWKGDQRASTVQIATLIANNDVTVVRDDESNKSGDPLEAERTWVMRVDSMLKDCSGLVVVLPYDSSTLRTTSPFLIPEILAADAQKIPILLFANPGVVLEIVDGREFYFPNFGKGQILTHQDVFRWSAGEAKELDATLMGAAGFSLKNAHVVGPLEYPNSRDHRATKNEIEEFVANCPVRRDGYPYVFNILPFSLKDSVHVVVAREVFKATGMACHISLDAITGDQSVRSNWERMLSQSSLVIAELSSLRDTCLFEVGCALGWQKPVYVLSKKGQEKLPFGLDDRSFHRYRSLDDLKEYVRETCCRAHRREVLNLSNDLRLENRQDQRLPGVPAWLKDIGGFNLDKRLTVSIWTICLSVAFTLQIGALLIWPSTPKPNIVAVLSLLTGFQAWTRFSREFWEKRLKDQLTWLPWLGMATVAALAVVLTVLITRAT